MSHFDQAVPGAIMMTSIYVGLDDGERQRRFGLNEEQSRASGACGLPGRAWTEHGAHQNAEIGPGTWIR